MNSALPEPARPWLRQLVSAERAGARLLCFPHAGGGASAYGRWSGHTPESHELWAVQYPGREDRITEPTAENIPSLAQQIAFAVQWVATTPYVLFGHSMGAIVAYETCCRLQCLGLPLPTRLFVNGSPPPDLAAELGEEDGAGPGGVWISQDEAHEHDAESRRLAEATVHADLALVGAYVPQGLRVEVPLTVLCNEEDPGLDEGLCRGWREFAGRECEVRGVPGGHFGCLTDPGPTLEAIRDAAEARRTPSSPPGSVPGW
ncbi:thioesterase II family protein [Streptomyces qinglanensis]|uniref:thioesterase II family protein n=1 Tax=Streptomyces qinglanensis TaxID=943816 RepID=UPI003D71E7EF